MQLIRTESPAATGETRGANRCEALLVEQGAQYSRRKATATGFRQWTVDANLMVVAFAAFDRVAP